jgi:hypothetical protein
MLETDLHTAPSRGARHRAQAGTVAIEFALVSILFFTLIFGTMELARIIYLYNTLAEATRSAAKAATNIDWRDTAALDIARQAAVFRTSPGTLLLGDPVTDQSVHIDYMSLAKAAGGALTMTPIPTASLPGCPSRNRQNCLENPYGASCVRLVRVRICSGDADVCDPVQYQPLFPLVSLPVPVPASTTIVSAESLGYSPGDALCP